MWGLTPPTPQRWQGHTRARPMDSLCTASVKHDAECARMLTLTNLITSARGVFCYAVHSPRMTDLRYALPVQQPYPI